MLSCESDSADLLASELKRIPGSEFAVRVSGVYDFFVKISSESDAELKKNVIGIRTNRLVKSSSTLMIVKPAG